MITTESAYPSVTPDGWTYLASDKEGRAVRSPSKRVSTTGSLNFIDTSLGPHVPEFDSPVVADTAEFCLFRWVERYLFNPGNMTPEFCRVSVLLLLGIPCIERMSSPSGQINERARQESNLQTRMVFSEVTVATQVLRGFQAMRRSL